MRRLYFMLFLFALRVTAAAAGNAAVGEFPFHFRDGLLWIQVTAPSSRRVLNFLLDSGAQVSVVDSETARELGMRGGRAVSVLGVGSRGAGHWPQALEAKVGDVPLPREYLNLDLNHLSTSCTNAVVDGIVGADFFRDKVVQIDFRTSVVRVLAEAQHEAASQVLPLKVRRCGMLLPVRIGSGTSEWVRLDTGCASGLQWVTASVHAEECTPRLAVALAPFHVPVTRTSVTLGSMRFENVAADVQEKEIFPGEKGLVGNALLSKFQTVTVDANRKEVVFGPAF